MKIRKSLFVFFVVLTLCILLSPSVFAEVDTPRSESSDSTCPSEANPQTGSEDNQNDYRSFSEEFGNKVIQENAEEPSCLTGNGEPRQDPVCVPFEDNADNSVPDIKSSASSTENNGHEENNPKEIVDGNEDDEVENFTDAQCPGDAADAGVKDEDVGKQGDVELEEQVLNYCSDEGGEPEVIISGLMPANSVLNVKLLDVSDVNTVSVDNQKLAFAYDISILYGDSLELEYQPAAFGTQVLVKVKPSYTVVSSALLTVNHINDSGETSAVDDVELCDGYISFYADGFSVYVATEDITPPTLTDIELSSTEVEASGSIEIKMSATDDLSGISSGGIRFMTESGGKKIYIYTSLSDTYYDEQWIEHKYEDGKLHGTLTIGQYTAAGSFKITDVSLSDYAGNIVNYSGSSLPDWVKSIALTVTNSNPDTEAPVLTNVTIDKNSVTAPDTVEMTIAGTDNLSGLTYGVVYLKTSGSDVLLIVNLGLTYLDGQGKVQAYNDGNLHGTIGVGEYAAAGEYKILYLSIIDDADNSADYSGDSLPDYAKAITLSVTNSKSDTAAPDMTGIELSSYYAETPCSLEMLVSATDDLSGIAFGNIYLNPENAGLEIFVYVSATYFDEHWIEHKYEDGKMHGTLKVGQYAASGNYKITLAILCDVAGNTKEYDSSNMPQFVKDIVLEVINTGRGPEPDNPPVPYVDNSGSKYIDKNVEIIGDKAVLTISGSNSAISGSVGYLQELYSKGINNLVIKTEKAIFTISISSLLRLLDGMNEYTIMIANGSIELWSNGKKIDAEFSLVSAV